MNALRRLFHRSISWATSAQDEEFLRAEIDKGIRSLDAGQGRESSIDDFLRQKNR